MNGNDFESAVNFLKEKTAYDEITIGCFLNHYGNPNVCCVCRGGYCKDAARCKRLDIVVKNAILEMKKSEVQINGKEILSCNTI